MKTLWQTAVVSLTVLAMMFSVVALTSSASRILGDIDRDGTLSTADVREMLFYMVGDRSFTAEERTLADCDGNRRIDTQDAKYILRVITQKQTPSTLPTTTTTVPTTTTTKSNLDDDGYFNDVVKP